MAENLLTQVYRKLEPGAVVMFREFCKEGQWCLSEEGQAFYDHIGKSGRDYKFIYREGDFSVVKFL